MFYFTLLGLGTSTAKEAKEYFADMQRHRIPFKYEGPEDDASINLVSLAFDSPPPRPPPPNYLNVKVGFNFDLSHCRLLAKRKLKNERNG